MEADQKRQLANLIVRHALKFGDFTLASGKKSPYYIDLRQVTLRPDGLRLIADTIMAWLAYFSHRHAAVRRTGMAIGGPSIGADPIVGAVLNTLGGLNVLGNQGAAIDYSGFLVRKATKEHGTGNLIEGPSLEGRQCLLVEDTVTTGGSLGKAVGLVRGAGGIVTTAIVVVDREEGAKEVLERRGVELVSLLTLTELAAFSGVEAQAMLAKKHDGPVGINDNLLVEIGEDAPPRAASFLAEMAARPGFMAFPAEEAK